MNGINFYVFLPFAAILLVIFLLRLRREKKAKDLLQSSSTHVKLYLAGSKKTISDGIKVYTVNDEKPALGRDENGNYVVLTAGENVISAGFVALKDFAGAAAMPSAAPAILDAKEKKADVRCTVNRGNDYILNFNRQTLDFEVERFS